MANNNVNMKLGKGDQVIQQWLDLQENKSWAIKFLLKQAIHRYGMNDLQSVLEGGTCVQPQGNVNTVVSLADAERHEDVKKVAESFTF